jgi:hypothetical protein
VTGGKPSALAVRLAAEAAHPEIQITTPLTSRSGRWELTTDGDGCSAYSGFWEMVDALAERYGDDL